jgi:hypothetical protein
MDGSEIVSFTGPPKRARIEFEGGAVFVGETRQKKPHGAGTLSVASEDGEEEACWSGTFAEGELAGEGEERTREYSFVGSFRAGVKHGRGQITFRSCGLVIEGQWKQGALHGRGCVVIFPDKKLRMTCKFDRGQFVSGKTGDGRQWEAQGEFPGSHPLQPDPYEERLVEEKKSTLAGAGQGLFAKCALAAGQLACYYNGLLVEHSVVDNRSWRYNSNTISLDDDFCLDVPLAHASSRVYCATLGHKVNSSRALCNAEYVPAFHPFWGSIKAVRTTRAVAAGEELFTFYDYRNERRPPSWFVDE